MEKEERELRKLEAEEASKDAFMSDAQTVVAPLIVKSIGRKKGSTVKAKEEFARLKEKLNEDIAIWWDRIKKDENDGTQLFEVVAIQKTLAELEHVVVKETTIISRVRRGNFVNVKEGGYRRRRRRSLCRTDSHRTRSESSESKNASHQC